MTTVRCSLLLLLLPCIAHAQVLSPATAPNLPFTVRPETTVITGPFDKNGLPDYAAALNARYGKDVTPDNNAAIPWLHLMGDTILPDDVRHAILKALGTAATPANTLTWSNKNIPPQLATTAAQLWPPADFPAVTAFLKDRGALLDQLVALSEKPRWFWPALTSPDNLYLHASPTYDGAPNLLRALASRATQRAAAHDLPGFQQDFLALVRLSQLLGAGPTTLDRTLAALAQSLAADTLALAVKAHAFGPGQWVPLAAINVSPIDILEPFDVLQRYLYLRATELAAIGALDHLPKTPGELGNPSLDAAIKHRQQLDWTRILWRINDEWDTATNLHRMPPGPARTTLTTQFQQRIRKDANDAITGPTALEPRPRESWADYSLRLQAVGTAISPLVIRMEEFAKRQDDAAATCTRLRALLNAGPRATTP